MSADSGKDRLGDKLRDLEHAREDVFFAERDRALIEKMRAAARAEAERTADTPGVPEAPAPEQDPK